MSLMFFICTISQNGTSKNIYFDLRLKIVTTVGKIDTYGYTYVYCIHVTIHMYTVYMWLLARTLPTHVLDCTFSNFRID